MVDLQLWLAKQNFHSMRHTFYEDLAEALEDDNPPGLAEEIEKHAIRAKKAGDVIAPIYRLWFRRMDDRSFSQALVGTVPATDVMILDAAEKSKALPQGLRFLATVIQAMDSMRWSVRRSVAGFSALLLFLFGALFLYSLYGVGMIEQIVPPRDWPWIGQVVRDIANFIAGTWIWLISVGSALLVAYAWSLPNWTGPGRALADRYLPFYSIYRDYQGAIFLVSMAALMQNQVSLTEALEILRPRASRWLRWHIRKIMLRLDYESKSPAKAFDTGIFNRRLTWRIEDFGARAKNDFSVAINKVGMKSLNKLTEDVQRSAEVLRNVLLLFGGGLLGLIVAGTLLTLYEAQASIQKQVNSVNVK